MPSTKRRLAALAVSFILHPSSFILLTVSLAAGAHANGSIVAWGYNESGECNVPSPNTGFVAVAGGVDHSLGLKADGSIVAWGYNDNGQCNVPPPNVGFVAVAAGRWHSLGLKGDGSIVGWGGLGNAPSPNTGFVSVAAGGYHGLGLKADGSIVAWGSNGDGQCNVPAPNTGFVALAGGGLFSLALKPDGSIVAWGRNDEGQCNVPEPNSGFVAVAAGGRHSLGLKADGAIVAWGYNEFGECNVPAPNTGFLAIAAGSEHSLGLKADGSIVAWGYNAYGQCNVPAPNTGFGAIGAGDWHSLGLKADGSLQVTIEPAEAVTAGAQWRRVGTLPWQDSGYTETDIPVGIYTIEFKDIAAWDTPSRQNVVVAMDQTTSTTGTYIRHMGTLQVTIHPAEAVTDGAQWSVDGGTTWRDSSTSATLPTGNYTVTFKQVAYWQTPSSLGVTIAKDQFVERAATYTALGSLQVTVEPAEAVAAGAQWSIDGGTTWRDSGALVVLPVGPYTVRFKPVVGRDTPADQATTVNHRETRQITVYYQPETKPPTVNAFAVTPTSLTLGNAFTVSFTVQDTGGSGLKEARLLRYRFGDPAMVVPSTHSLSGNGPVSGFLSDTPPREGVYLYGLNVEDNAQNENDEKNTATGGQPGIFGPITVTVQAVSEPLPNLTFGSCNFGPEAPIQLWPGDSLTLGAFLDNSGLGAAAPFWLEFWGSRTGGLTLDHFLADSLVIPSIGAGGGYSYTGTRPLYSVPDGPYTVVFAADRPNLVQESNERDNRGVVAGKRLLVVRPQTNADLAIEGFAFAPTPVQSGQLLSLSGRVRNVGTQASGPFWIEFWGSYDRLYPQLNFLLCDSIAAPNLLPGGAIDLSQFTRTLYDCPGGVFKVGVFADRLDQVNETDETNNYAFVDGVTINRTLSPEDVKWPVSEAAGPDLVVVSVNFSPFSPTQATPGSAIMLWARVENQGSAPSGPFWIEFWGSRLGGLSLDQLVADSGVVPAIPAGGAVDLSLTRSLYSIPDGPYTITVVADRPGQVAESNEGNNRRAVAGKRLLSIRPQTQANLVVESFSLGPNPMRAGQPLTLGGRVRNSGSESSGPFWIELWGSADEDYPVLGFFLCDSIPVANLAPSAAVDLSTYSRTVYPGVPVGNCAVFCFADRIDQVNETNEADNYSILRGYQIAP